MKTLLTKLFFLISLVLGALPVNAYDFEVDGIYYSFVSTGDLTCRLEKVDKNYGRKLIIPETVIFNGRNISITEIASNCIADCLNLNELILSNKKVKLEENCFASCQPLLSVDLSRYEGNLPKGCFMNCINLKNVILPKDINFLSSNLFKNCKNLEDLEIPLGVIRIEESCFSDANLNSIIIPRTIWEIGGNAFYNSKISEGIEIPEGLVEMKDYCFNKAELPFIILPSSINTLGKGVFSNSKIDKIYLDPTTPLKKLPVKTFEYSSVSDLTLPESIEEFGDYAIRHCKSLKYLKVPKNLKKIGSGSLSENNFDLLELNSSIEDVHYSAFENTNVGKLIWGIPNLNEKSFKKNWELYYDSFWFDEIKECIITENCDFLYLGYFHSFVSNENYKPRALFYRSNMQKLILSDSESQLEIGFCLHLSRVSSAEAEFVHFIPSDFHSPSFIHQSWLSSLQELYLGRDILGNKLHVPNLKKLTIGNVSRVDIENAVSLEIIQCNASTPPSFDNLGLTTQQYLQIPVIVPNGTKESYQSAEGWKNFWNIITQDEYDSLYPKEITLAETNIAIKPRETYKLDFSFLPSTADEKLILWSSSDEEIASVSPDGIITGKSFGEVTINAYCADISASCQVSVQPEIIVKEPTLTLKAGDWHPLYYKILPSDLKRPPMVFSSSDSNVAYINDDEIINAIEPGNAVLTITCGGATASMEVTVVNDDSHIGNITLDSDTKYSVYTIDGVLIKKNCDMEDIKKLSKGVYIILTGNKPFKISI